MKRVFLLFVMAIVMVLCIGCEEKQEVPVLGYGPSISIDRDGNVLVDQNRVDVRTEIDGEVYMFTIDSDYAYRLGILEDGDTFEDEITWNADTGRMEMMIEPDGSKMLPVKFVEDIGAWVLD